jgi:hypothetical protein
MNSNKILLVYFIVLCLVIFLACNRISPIELENLVMNASAYNGKLVVVRGCFYRGFEVAVISSCLKPEPKKQIWIEPYSKIEWLLKNNPKYGKEFIKREGTLSDKDKRLASQFAEIPFNTPTNVVLQGEFRFSKFNELGNNEDHKYELILHRVLGISSGPAVK